MENKKSWFTLQPDKKLEAFYFAKDEQGQEIFYPWGQPGDSYYINEKQKKVFVGIYTSLLIFFLVSCVLLYRPLEFTKYISVFGLIVLFINLALVLERGFPALYAKKLKFYKRDKKELVVLNFFKEMFILSSIQYACILIGLFLNHYNIFLWGAGSLITIIYPVIIFSVFKKHNL